MNSHSAFENLVMLDLVIDFLIGLLRIAVIYCEIEFRRSVPQSHNKFPNQQSDNPSINYQIPNHQILKCVRSEPPALRWAPLNSTKAR
jgi:hypothetical protein